MPKRQISPTASIAAMILTTETLITDLKDEKSAAAGADL